ncbi:MAG: beta-N-acetylglucosaminidase domain-containing protein [Clostridia bacterium]|nr:beta-N-acetylglucosaminidase domain-containing protein [Clostridia bacterium]
MYKEFYPLNQFVAIKKRRYRKDGALPPDGFTVEVKSSGECLITYQSVRAKSYARAALKSQTIGGKAPVMRLKDYPSFPLRGVVEGFYGKPYTHEQRAALMPLLKKLKMNAYIYAPKDDEYHRARWREDYPQAEAEKLKELFESAKKNEIDFFFAISPGNDFDFANGRDYEILLQKLKKVKAMGVTKFALLMDDIEPKLSEEAKKSFSSPAAAHAYLANYLLENLCPASPFLFCPTDYMQNFDTPYREELRKTLDKKIEVFWTGYNTVAEAITEEDGETVTRAFDRKPVLWDNYPVNDFNPKRRVYFGAIAGRGRKLHESHIGYIANLSELYECNKIPLATMADYAWDCEGYDAEQSLESAVREYFKGCVNAGRVFVKENAANIMRAPLRRTKLFETPNFKALNRHYLRVYAALITLQEKAPEAFREEAKELIGFMKTECELYFRYQGGGKKETMQAYAEPLNGSRYAPYDLSFLKHLNETYSFETPFTVDEDRVIYRNWEK